MKIAFVHPHKSFLPALDAYIRFFSTYHIETAIYYPEEFRKIRADVAWHFMGWDMAGPQKNLLRIHDYCSASTPPLPGIKDFLKSRFQHKPDFRLFLNEWVMEQIPFADGIPFGFRDVGIDPDISRSKKPAKNYDFIYTGTVDRQRGIGKLLRRFTKEDLKNHSLLVLSRNYENLENEFGKKANIHFKGPVAPAEVPDHILSARFAINWIPDIEPFNRQASAKFLEYCNLHVPVISSNYAWVSEFRKIYGGDYFFLDQDLTNLNWEKINAQAYSFPDLSEWSWENRIRGSGVLEFLGAAFGGLKFT